MNVHLTGEIEQLVQEQVDAGNYASPEEMVEAALRIFIYQETQEELDVLRAAVAVGIAQADAGLVKPWDSEKARARVLAIVGKSADASTPVGSDR